MVFANGWQLQSNGLVGRVATKAKSCAALSFRFEHLRNGLSQGSYPRILFLSGPLGERKQHTQAGVHLEQQLVGTPKCGDGMMLGSRGFFVVDVVNLLDLYSTEHVGKAESQVIARSGFCRIVRTRLFR